MCFILVVLPIVLILFGRFTYFFILFLMFIEILIVICIFIRYNSDYFKYNIDGRKLNLKEGIFSREVSIYCDKIKIVHVVNYKDDFEIIIITDTRGRKEDLKIVNEILFKKYPYIFEKYKYMKITNPENEFYYKVIYKGGYNKYMVLDSIYRNSINAHFSDEAIEKIKQYRN